jgi:hypothetical protein
LADAKGIALDEKRTGFVEPERKRRGQEGALGQDRCDWEVIDCYLRFDKH